MSSSRVGALLFVLPGPPQPPHSTGGVALNRAVLGNNVQLYSLRISLCRNSSGNTPSTCNTLLKPRSNSLTSVFWMGLVPNGEVVWVKSMGQQVPFTLPGWPDCMTGDICWLAVDREGWDLNLSRSSVDTGVIKWLWFHPSCGVAKRTTHQNKLQAVNKWGAFVVPFSSVS